MTTPYTPPDPGLSRAAVAALLPASNRPAMSKADAIAAVRRRWPTMDGILARKLLDDQVANGWAVWVPSAPEPGAVNQFPEGLRRTRAGDRMVREAGRVPATKRKPRLTDTQVLVLRVCAGSLGLHDYWLPMGVSRKTLTSLGRRELVRRLGDNHWHITDAGRAALAECGGGRP